MLHLSLLVSTPVLLGVDGAALARVALLPPPWAGIDFMPR